MWIFGSFRPLVLLGSLSLFLHVKCVPQSPPPSPPPVPPTVPPPSSKPPTSSSPATSPPSPPATSPAPPGTTPAPPESTLDPQKAEIEVQNIFDIIKGGSSDKASALFEIYDMYPNCPDRLAIEQAYVKSKFNFDKPEDGAEHELSDEDKEKFRLFMGTFLFGCDVAIPYAYHMKVLCDKEDSVRGITGSLVACTESPEIQKALQTKFNERFAEDDDKIFEKITKAVGENDTKNVCGSILNITRAPPLDKPDEAKAKQTVDDLLKEEKESDGWADSREILDKSLLGLPLNQCQLVVKDFSKDGKDFIEVFKENFKDKENDEDKFTVYSQIVTYVQMNVTFFGDELKYGLEKKDARYPMRIITALKQKTFFAEIEGAAGVGLRQEIKDVTSAAEADYPGKFFDLVFEKEYANQDSAPAPATPYAGPASSSPPSPSPPPTSTPPPSTTPPPPKSPPPPPPPPATPATSSSSPSSPPTTPTSSSPPTSPPSPPSPTT